MQEKNVLKEQTSMKVVLNGGKYQLNDATIPFQIAFDEKIAKKEPTHILVMDITDNVFRNKNRTSFDSCAERSLFKLEPVHYLQLKKPGVHHLIFILLKGEINEDEHKFLFEKQNRSYYRNDLYFDSIESMSITNEVAYCEVVISVPEEFFALKPKTGVKKTLWKWVNSWYSLEPIDQCEYRKRAIFAFTAKPVLWIIGFLIRFILVTVWTIFFLIWKIFALFFGYQPVKFIPYKKNVWYKFLVLYPEEDFDVLNPGEWTDLSLGEQWEESYYPFKTLAIGKKRIHTPLTLAGIIFYCVMFAIYILSTFLIIYSDLPLIKNLLALIEAVSISLAITILTVSITLPTLKKNKEWKNKWNEKYPDGKKLRKNVRIWIFSILAGSSLLSFMITQIPWVEIFNSLLMIVIFIISILILSTLIYGIIKLVSKIQIKKLMNKKGSKEPKFVLHKQEHQQWLQKSFDINNLPKKIDFKTMPEPSTTSHRFVLTFWRTKAKVCKPYAK